MTTMSSRPLSLGDQIKARADLIDQIGGEFGCFLNTDLDLEITMANQALGDQLGVSPLALVGRSLLDLVDEDSHEDLREYLSKVKKGRRRKRPFVTALSSYTATLVPGSLYAIRSGDQFALAFLPAAVKHQAVPAADNGQATEQLLKLASNLPGASSLEDLNHLVLAFGPRIFPGQVGALYIPTGDRGNLRLVAQWPETSAPISTDEFHQLENMAIRYGRLFIHGLDESGIPCRHVLADVGPIAFRPTFRDGRLACLFALTVKTAEDDQLRTLRTFGDLITEAVMRVRQLRNF